MTSGRPATSGPPPGAVVSPTLANIYLHYTFDLWADQWRRHHARGNVVLVRYADDSSQRDRTTWDRAAQLVAAFLPAVRIIHPWPHERFVVNHPRWKPVRESRPPGFVRGALRNECPYRDRLGGLAAQVSC